MSANPLCPGCDNLACRRHGCQARRTMTPAEREAQRRSFAYGNVAIDNPLVTRALVDEVAERGA